MYFFVFLTTKDRNKADRRGHSISRNASRVLFWFYFMRIRVTGKEMLDSNQAYIFVFNHTSLLDVPACTLANNHTFKFLAKAELAKVPLFGYIVRNLYLTVKRGSPEDRALSLDKMNETLKRGISILIYPEGTRNKSTEPLGPLYDGAFKLSKETATPIAVAAIIGSKKLLNNTEMQPGTMKINWQGIIAPQANDTIETLKEKTRLLLLEGIRKR